MNVTLQHTEGPLLLPFDASTFARYDVDVDEIPSHAA